MDDNSNILKKNQHTGDGTEGHPGPNLHNSKYILHLPWFSGTKEFKPAPESQAQKSGGEARGRLKGGWKHGPKGRSTRFFRRQVGCQSQKKRENWGGPEKAWQLPRSIEELMPEGFTPEYTAETGKGQKKKNKWTRGKNVEELQSVKHRGKGFFEIGGGRRQRLGEEDTDFHFKKVWGQIEESNPNPPTGNDTSLSRG